MLTAGVLSVTGSTPAFENVRRCERVSGAGRPGGRLTQRYDTERAPGGSTSDVRDAGAGAPTIVVIRASWSPLRLSNGSDPSSSTSSRSTVSGVAPKFVR